MNYFVTGASGFIGQHLVRRLLVEEGASVACLVRDSAKLPGDLRDRVRVCPGDSTCLERYADVIADADVIFHIGARAELGDGSSYQRDNIDFTDALIRHAERCTNLERFVFASTIGAVDRTQSDDCSRPLTEESRPNPLTDYGKSKLVCEQHLAGSALPYTIVRPVLVYGPGMRKRSHLRVFIDGVIERKPFTRLSIPGRVSLIHVEDLVTALLLVARHPGALRQTYFAADGEPVSLGTIFRELGTILGVPAGRIGLGRIVPRFLRSMRSMLPLQLQSLASDVLVASNEKICRLGFAPNKDRYDGFRETVHSHTRDLRGVTGIAAVTGGAGGIGRAIAEQLYAHGYDLLIIDSNEQEGRQTAELLRGSMLQADLTLPHDLKRVQAALKSISPDLRILVNNAGIGRRGVAESLTDTNVANVVAVNCVATVLLTNTVIPLFVRNGRGTLINIGSSAGYQPLPYMAVYAASKAFVIRFTEALQGELRGRGIPPSVEILLASPSGTATNFQRASGVKSDDAAALLTPGTVAAAIVGRIGRGSASFIIGGSGKGMALAARLLPSSIQVRLWERLMRAMR